jgi:hypothetical protein
VEAAEGQEDPAHRKNLIFYLFVKTMLTTPGCNFASLARNTFAAQVCKMKLFCIFLGLLFGFGATGSIGLLPANDNPGMEVRGEFPQATRSVVHSRIFSTPSDAPLQVLLFFTESETQNEEDSSHYSVKTALTSPAFAYSWPFYLRGKSAFQSLYYFPTVSTRRFILYGVFRI